VSWFVNDSLWGGVGLVMAGAIAAYLLIRYTVLPAIHAVAKRSPIKWDDLLLDRKVLHRVALTFPVIVARAGIPALPLVSENWAGFTIRFTEALLIVLSLYALNGLLKAVNNYYVTLPVAASRPIKGYLQVLMIVASVFGAVVAVARLADQSVGFFLGGLGAMTAVLLLIFQDTILSLVASVQLTQNDMLRVGDWIEIPDIGVDGDVIDVALHTVKVQNWDKTISTVPTHRLISKTFRNWRGMSEAGGRRIKRSLHIDATSVRFIDEDELNRFSAFEPLSEYMKMKADELASWNAERTVPEGVWGDPRRLTNLGTFRAYVGIYLRRHPGLATDRMTTLVRLLPPTPEGVPLEIYVFTADTEWITYEGIQSDILDHMLAMLPEFGLRLFQKPSGADIRIISS
jgi:miniconductance mechanosensitive channel